MYKVVIDKYAQKQLSKIRSPQFDRIINAINKLAYNPRPAGYKKLKNRPGYRIRVGDYRVIYTIEVKKLFVFIIDIGHRSDIYD